MEDDRKPLVPSDKGAQQDAKQELTGTPSKEQDRQKGKFSLEDGQRLFRDVSKDDSARPPFRSQGFNATGPFSPPSSGAITKKTQCNVVVSPPKTPKTYSCFVCGIASESQFSVDTCDDCKIFFRSNVKSISQPFCEGSGNCEVTANYDQNCSFCWLNKCYKTKLNPWSIRGERDYMSYLEERKKPGGEAREQKRTELVCQYLTKLLREACDLFASPEYKRALDRYKNSESRANLVRRKVVLDLIASSRFVENALRLDTAFIYPPSCGNQLLCSFLVTVYCAVKKIQKENLPNRLFAIFGEMIVYEFGPKVHFASAKKCQADILKAVLRLKSCEKRQLVSFPKEHFLLTSGLSETSELPSVLDSIQQLSID